MRFEEFSVGDYVTFVRRFVKSDFRAFQRLSGDSNPLHHDHEYGAASEFGQTIVPLHMVAAPLSAIAGMHFPGDPSLYLGHEIRALLPVYFGEKLTYSARIVAINSGLRVLTLSVLVLRGLDVVIESQMRVQSRQDEWRTAPKFTRRGPPHAVITGATGSIGGAIARELARRGWKLWLHARRNTPELHAIVAECRELGSEADLIAADLKNEASRREMAKRLQSEDAPSTLVHTASPMPDAGFTRLAEVNYEALKDLTEAMLPGLLGRQAGTILMIGSTALLHFPSGWDDYIAAKAMSATYVTGISRRNARFGVNGLVLSPGFVRTAFSAKWRKKDTVALLPEEVAEAAADMLIAGEGRDSSDFMSLEAGHAEFGTWGFQPMATAQVEQIDSLARPAQAESPASRGVSELETTVRQLLNLPSSVSIIDAGLGRTPGWDSLRHIELILAIERAYRIKFSTTEIEQTHDFDGLAKLWKQKVSL